MLLRGPTLRVVVQSCRAAALTGAVREFRTRLRINNNETRAREYNYINFLSLNESFVLPYI